MIRAALCLNPPRSLSGVAGGETWVKKNGAYILRLGGGAGATSGTARDPDHTVSAPGGTVLTGTGVAGGAGGRGGQRNSHNSLTMLQT